jgi:hypothetical protein
MRQLDCEGGTRWELRPMGAKVLQHFGPILSQVCMKSLAYRSLTELCTHKSVLNTTKWIVKDKVELKQEGKRWQG